SLYPMANIAAIDYDPGAREVNQLNLIRLMLATADKNAARKAALDEDSEYDSVYSSASCPSTADDPDTAGSRGSGRSGRSGRADRNGRSGRTSQSGRAAGKNAGRGADKSGRLNLFRRKKK
ncbi:MAG: hypothetical protein VZQ95_10280, partial [Erysipelotrichaceae bacterium]|nr:hypothetical protein [Erysipelotrichaceae bacterium]